VVDAGPNRIAVFWAALKPRPGEENAPPTGPFLFTEAVERSRTPAPSMRAAIERHHPGTLEAGLPYGESLWFIVGGDGQVLHTGRGLGWGSSAVARADLERKVPGVRIGQITMSSSVKDAQGKGIDLVWARVATPEEAAATPAGPFAQVRTYYVTSPVPDQEVSIRLEGEAASNPNAFRVLGKFTAEGSLLRARTPFTFMVVSDAPFGAAISTTGGEVEFGTQWEGRESRFRASSITLKRDSRGGPVMTLYSESAIRGFDFLVVPQVAFRRTDEGWKFQFEIDQGGQ
jgi:hypothetical protein